MSIKKRHWLGADVADILEMQIELAKRALRQIKRRAALQLMTADGLEGDARQDALRVLSEILAEGDEWERKLAALAQSRSPREDSGG